MMRHPRSDHSSAHSPGSRPKSSVADLLDANPQIIDLQYLDMPTKLGPKQGRIGDH
jgi:hypothetical protein